MERETKASRPFVFILSVGAIQVLGIAAIAMTAVWMAKYLGGFAWDGSSQEFNYHPLLMVTSMVFLFSEGTIELIFWYRTMALIMQHLFSNNKI